jgi:uncharacterized membrane protein
MSSQPAGHVELDEAEVKVRAERIESKVMGVVGAGLLGMAGFFVWRELLVPVEALMALGTVAAVGLAEGLRRRAAPLVGPLLVLGAIGLSSLWYGASRAPLLLFPLGLAFGAAVAFALAEPAPGRREPGVARWHRLLLWQGVALGGLVTSFAVYFQVFDASDLSLEAFVGRRALLSLAWLVGGVALVLRGRSRRAPEVRDAGFVVLAAAVAKLALYDTTHLDGLWRIGALSVAGGVLLAASRVVRRLNAGGR